MKVVIDGVEYVPSTEEADMMDTRLHYHYFMTSRILDFCKQNPGKGLSEFRKDPFFKFCWDKEAEYNDKLNALK